MASAYVQAFGLKALARAFNHVLNFRTLDRARLWKSGGGLVLEDPGHLKANRDTWEALYRAHSGWLTRRMRWKFGEAAEDLVQETFVRFMQVRPEGVNPRAYLLTIARNLAISRFRSHDQRRRVAGEPPVSRLRGEADQVELIMLKQIIAGMPPVERRVFLMARVDGLTIAQIGAKLGVSSKTVEYRMTKALAHCTAKLRGT